MNRSKSAKRQTKPKAGPRLDILDNATKTNSRHFKLPKKKGCQTTLLTSALKHNHINLTPIHSSLDSHCNTTHSTHLSDNQTISTIDVVRAQEAIPKFTPLATPPSTLPPALLSPQPHSWSKLTLSELVGNIKKRFSIKGLGDKMKTNGVLKRPLATTTTTTTPMYYPTLSSLIPSCNPLTLSKSLIHSFNRYSTLNETVMRRKQHRFGSKRRTKTVQSAPQRLYSDTTSSHYSPSLTQFQPFDQHSPLETIKLIRQYIMTIQYAIQRLRQERQEKTQIGHPDHFRSPSNSILEQDEIQTHFTHLNQYLTTTATDPTVYCHHEAKFLFEQFDTSLPESYHHLYSPLTNDNNIHTNGSNLIETIGDGDVPPPDGELYSVTPTTLNHPNTHYSPHTTNLTPDEHFYLNITILRAYTLFNDLPRATLLALKLIGEADIIQLNSLSIILCDLATALARDNQYKLALFVMSTLHQQRIPHSKATPFVVIAKAARQCGDLDSVNTVLDIIMTPMEYYRPKEEIQTLESQSQHSLQTILSKANKKKTTLSNETDADRHEEKNSTTSESSALESKASANDDLDYYDEFSQDNDDDDDSDSNDNDDGKRSIASQKMSGKATNGSKTRFEDDDDDQEIERSQKNEKFVGNDRNQHFEAFMDKQSAKINRLRYRKQITGIGVGLQEETLVVRHQIEKANTDSDDHNSSTSSTTPNLDSSHPKLRYRDVLIPYKTRHVQSIIASSLAAYTNANLPHHAIQLLLHSASLLNGRSPVSLLGHHDFTHNTSISSLHTLLDQLKPLLPPHLHQFEVRNLMLAAERAGNAHFAAAVFNSRLSVTESNFLLHHEIGNGATNNVQLPSGITITSPLSPLQSNLKLDESVIAPALPHGHAANAMPFLASFPHSIQTKLKKTSNDDRLDSKLSTANTTLAQTVVSYDPTQPEAMLGFLLDRMKIVTLKPSFDLATDSHLFSSPTPTIEPNQNTGVGETDSSTEKLNTYSRSLKQSSTKGYFRLFSSKRASHSQNDAHFIKNDLEGYCTVDGYATSAGDEQPDHHPTKLYLSRRLFYTSPEHYPLYYNHQHDVSLFPDHLGKQYNLLKLDKKMNKGKYVFDHSIASAGNNKTTISDPDNFLSLSSPSNCDKGDSIGFDELNSTDSFFQFASLRRTKTQRDEERTTAHLDETFTHPSSLSQSIPSQSEVALSQVYYPVKNFMAVHPQLEAKSVPVFIKPFLKKVTHSIETTQALLHLVKKYPAMSSQIKCLLYPELLHQSQSFDWNDNVLQEQMGIVKSAIRTLFRAGELTEATSLLLSQLTSLTSTAAIIPVIDPDNFIYKDNGTEGEGAKKRKNLVSHCLDDTSTIFSTFQSHLHTTQPSLWNLLPSLSQLPSDPLDHESQRCQIYQGSYVKYITEHRDNDLKLITNALFPTLFTTESISISSSSPPTRTHQTKYLKGGILNPNYVGNNRNSTQQSEKITPLTPLNPSKAHFNPIPLRPTHNLFTQSDITGFLMSTLADSIEAVAVDHNDVEDSHVVRPQKTSHRKNNPAMALALWKIFGYGPNAQLLLPAQLPLFGREDISDALGREGYEKLIKMVGIDQLESPLSTIASKKAANLQTPNNVKSSLLPTPIDIASRSSALHPDHNALLHQSYVMASTLPIDQLEFFRSSITDHLASLPFPLKKVKLFLPLVPENSDGNPASIANSNTQSVFGQVLAQIVTSAQSHGQDPLSTLALFTNSLRPDSALYPVLSPFFYKMYRNRVSAIELHRAINRRQLPSQIKNNPNDGAGQLKPSNSVPILDVFDHELTISLVSSNQTHFDPKKGPRAGNAIDSPEALIFTNNIDNIIKPAQKHQFFAFGGLNEPKTIISVSSPGLLPFTPRPLLQHGIGYLEGFSPLDFDGRDVQDVDTARHMDANPSGNNDYDDDDDDDMIPTSNAIPTQLFESINPTVTDNDRKTQQPLQQKDKFKQQQMHLKQFTSQFNTHAHHGQIVTTDAIAQSIVTALTELFTGNDLGQDGEDEVDGDKARKNTTPFSAESTQSLTFILNTISSLMQTDQFQYPASYYYTTAFQREPTGLIDGLKHFSLFNQTLLKSSSPLLSLHISLSHRLIANPRIARMVSHAALITGQLKLNQSVWDKHYFLTLAHRTPALDPTSRPSTNSALLKNLNKLSQGTGTQLQIGSGKRRVIYAGSDNSHNIPETPEQTLERLRSPLRKVLTVDEWILSTSIPQIPRLGVQVDIIPDKLDPISLPSYSALAHYNSQQSLKLITTPQTRQLLPFTKRITPITTPEQLEYRILTFLHNKMTEYGLVNRDKGNNEGDFTQEIPLVNAHSREHGRFIGNRVPRWSSGKYEDELLDELIRSDEMEDKVVDLLHGLGIVSLTSHREHFKKRPSKPKPKPHSTQVPQEGHSRNDNHSKTHSDTINDDDSSKPLLSTQIDGHSIAKSLQKNNKNMLLLLVQQVEAVHGDESPVTKNNIFYQLYQQQKQLPLNTKDNNNASTSTPTSKHENQHQLPTIAYPSLPDSTKFNYHTDLTHEQKLLLVSETLRLDTTLELRYFFESFTRKLTFKSLLYSNTTSLSPLSPHQRAISRSLNYVSTAVQSGFPQLASLYILKSLFHPQFRQFLGFQTLNRGHLSAYRDSIQTHPLFFIVQNAISQMALNYPALAYQTYLHCESAGLFQPFTDTSTLSAPPLPGKAAASSAQSTPVASETRVGESGKKKKHKHKKNDQVEVETDVKALQSQFPTRSTPVSGSHTLTAPLPSSSASFFNPNSITQISTQSSALPRPASNSLANSDTGASQTNDPTNRIEAQKLYNTIFVRLLMQSISGVPLFIDANHIYPKQQPSSNNGNDGRGSRSNDKTTPNAVITSPPDVTVQRDKDLLMNMIKTNHPMLVGIDSPFIQRNIAHHPLSNVPKNSDSNDTQQQQQQQQPIQRLYAVTPHGVLAKPQHELDLTNILIDTSPLLPPVSKPVETVPKTPELSTKPVKEESRGLFGGLFSRTLAKAAPPPPQQPKPEETPKPAPADPKTLIGTRYAGIKLSDLSPSAKKQIGFFGLMLISSNLETQTHFSYMQPSRWTDASSLGTGSGNNNNNNNNNNNVNKMGLIIEDDPTKLTLTPLDNSDQVGLHLGDYTPSYIYNEVNKEMGAFGLVSDNGQGGMAGRGSNTNEILRENQHPLIRKLSTISGLSLSQMYMPAPNTDEYSAPSASTTHSHSQSTVQTPTVTLDTSGMFHCTKMFAVKSLYDRNLQHLIRLDPSTQRDFVAYQAKTIISSMLNEAQQAGAIGPGPDSTNNSCSYTIQRGMIDVEAQKEGPQIHHPPQPGRLSSPLDEIHNSGSLGIGPQNDGTYTIDPTQFEHIEQLIEMVSELPHDGLTLRP